MTSWFDRTRELACRMDLHALGKELQTPSMPLSLQNDPSLETSWQRWMPQIAHLFEKIQKFEDILGPVFDPNQSFGGTCKELLFGQTEPDEPVDALTRHRKQNAIEAELYNLASDAVRFFNVKTSGDLTTEDKQKIDTLMSLYGFLMAGARKIDTLVNERQTPNDRLNRIADNLVVILTPYALAEDPYLSRAVMGFLRDHGRLGTECIRKVSLTANDKTRVSHTRNYPNPMAHDAPLMTKHPDAQILFSDLDFVVITMMAKSLNTQSLDGTLAVVDRLAQEYVDVYESFDKIMRTPILINEVFSKTPPQQNKFIMPSAQKMTEMVDELKKNQATSHLTVPKALSKPSQHENFFDLLKQENGLILLGAVYLDSCKTRLSLKNVLEKRMKDQEKVELGGPKRTL